MGLPPAEVDNPNVVKPLGTAQQDNPPWAQANGEDLDEAAEVARRQSNVFYSGDTIWARIASSGPFMNATLTVIVFNAIWIGIDVDWNHPVYKEQRPELKSADKLPLEPVSTVIENMFCFYFTIELTIRFLAYKRKCDCVKDRWFVFDGLLVLFMVIETWVLAIVGLIMGGGSSGILAKFSALRLLRLLRLTRMARLMREVPELLTLVKGMMNAMRAVFFILMFLLLCMYVFAIVFTAQLGDPDAPENKYPQRYWETWMEVNGTMEMTRDEGPDPTAIDLFGSMGDSMMTLFTRGMLGDNLAETLEAIKDRGGEISCEGQGEPGFEYNSDVCEREGGSVLLMWAFIIFMIISAFCLLNMLIGVLCEVIQDSAERENESTQISELKTNMKRAFHLIDTSKDGLITRNEWKHMRNQKTVQDSMASLGVEEQHMEERLDQMQESLFGIADEDEEEEPEGQMGAVVPMGSDQDMAGSRSGLTFDQFIEKVVEIRPDTPASALDIEILRVRVEREEKTFNARLDFIEEALKGVNGVQALPLAGANQTDIKPSIKLDSDLKSGSTTAWLKDVPTEVLFAVLNSRAPPELGPPSLLTDNR